MPMPMPLTMKVADQVKASVAYWFGAMRVISNVCAVSAGAMSVPAKNAMTAKTTT